MEMTPQIAMQYVNHGDEQIALMARQYLAMWAACRNLYYGAWWVADRPVDEKRMWEDVKEACKFPDGYSPDPTEMYALLKDVQRGKE